MGADTISGSKRDEITGWWKRLHIVKLHELYSSSSSIWMVELRRMRWIGHETCMGERRSACVFVGEI